MEYNESARLTQILYGMTMVAKASSTSAEKHFTPVAATPFFLRPQLPVPKHHTSILQGGYLQHRHAQLVRECLGINYIAAFTTDRTYSNPQQQGGPSQEPVW
jgi:hypothetical protein